MHILTIGAIGLVGQDVLHECLEAADVSEVAALGRHATWQSDPKLSEIDCPDFSMLDAVEDRLQPFDACLYCTGAPPIGTRERRNTGTSERRQRLENPYRTRMHSGSSRNHRSAAKSHRRPIDFFRARRASCILSMLPASCP